MGGPRTNRVNILPRVDNVVNGIMQTEETSSESCPEVVRRDLASQKTSSNSCPAAPKVYLGYYLRGATNVVASSATTILSSIVRMLSGSCPEVVRILSGSCPDLVRGEDRINTKV